MKKVLITTFIIMGIVLLGGVGGAVTIGIIGGGTSDFKQEEKNQIATIFGDPNALPFYNSDNYTVIFGANTATYSAQVTEEDALTTFVDAAKAKGYTIVGGTVDTATHAEYEKAGTDGSLITLTFSFELMLAPAPALADEPDEGEELEDLEPEPDPAEGEEGEGEGEEEPTVYALVMTAEYTPGPEIPEPPEA